MQVAQLHMPVLQAQCAFKIKSNRNAQLALMLLQVVQGTIRDLANQVFEHLHRLDLAFHLSRQTGAINRIIDRGTRGINFILSSMVCLCLVVMYLAIV